MAIPSYESPTFLGQKDAYLAGLTLPQLMASIVIGGLWFMVAFLFPYGMIGRLIIAGGLTGLSVILLFARVAGMNIPMFLGLSLLRVFVKPGFEERAEHLIDGDPDWVELRLWNAERAERAKLAGSKRSMFAGLPGRGKKAASLVTEQQRQEVKTDLEKGVSDASMAVEQGVRDAVRSFMKGG